MLDDNLEQRLTNLSGDELEHVVKELGRARDLTAVPALIKYLHETDSATLRNAVALALRDIGNPKAIDHLVAVAQDPKTEGKRGTLLYALKKFDVSEHVGTLIDHVLYGEFEASREALEAIELSFHRTSPFVARQVIKRLEKRIEDLEDQLSFLSAAVESLEERCP